MNEDIERLRAGERLTIVPREAGLVFHDERTTDRPRALGLVFEKEGDPEQPSSFPITEHSIEWMQNVTSLTENLVDLGFPEGKLVVCHRTTDDETIASMLRIKNALAQPFVPEPKSVAADRVTDQISVQKFKRGASGRLVQVEAARRRHDWMTIVLMTVGAVAAIVGATQQHDDLGRNLCVVIALVLTGIAAWTFWTARSPTR
ncbi:MAG: hypothetical protein QM831_22270 [Kofleriaceae bacterium]